MKILTLQYDIAWLQPDKNVAFIKESIENNDSADLVVLPEMCLSGFCMNPEKAALTEDDEHINALITLCEKSDTAIIGSFAIKEEDSFYNRVLLLSADGIIGRYDKQYLFSPSGENKAYQIKHAPSLLPFKGWNILPQVCYDLRFPESVRNGDIPDLLIYMANWPVPRIHHWDALLRARAIENQCFVVAVNRIGKDMNNWEYCGHSQVIAPSGEVEMIQDGDSILSKEIDKTILEEYRKKYPFLEDKY